MSAFNEETVLSIHHWTDRLFTFKTTMEPHAGRLTLFKVMSGELRESS